MRRFFVFCCLLSLFIVFPGVSAAASSPPEEPICYRVAVEISGSITDADTGAPITNAEVSVRTIWTPGGWIHESVAVTSDGVYDLVHPVCTIGDDSEPGYVRVTAPGYRPGFIRGTITSGEEIINLTLEPAGATAAVAWAGLRSSGYGATYDPDDLPNQPFDFPTEETWGEAITEFQSNYNAADPFVVWIVGEADYDNGGVMLEFPEPAGWTGTDPLIRFVPTGHSHEDYLEYFDAQGIDVFLQVEPGHADVAEQIEAVLLAFQHHPSVVGFGVDVEFYDYAGEQGQTNAPVTDDLAREWEMLVKSYNPDYQLFLKHFHFADNLPPTYRGDVIFVDDIQDMGSMDVFLRAGGWGMIDFADAAAPNPVMYQIGYPADWYYGDDPEETSSFDVSPDNPPWYPAGLPSSVSGALISATDSRQDVGIVWVDFTMRRLYPEIFGGDARSSWEPGVTYAVDDVVTYNGATWACTYAHTSNAAWYPGAPGLWFWQQQ